MSKSTLIQWFLGILISIVLSTTLFVIFNSNVISNIWNCRDPEFDWLRQSRYSAEGIRDALICYINRTGSLPGNASDIIDAGCLLPGTSFEPSRGKLYQLQLVGHSEWKQMDQIMIRRKTDRIMLPTSIIAVVLPSQTYSTKTFVVCYDGSVKYITKTEWEDDKVQLRDQLGGADLWP